MKYIDAEKLIAEIERRKKSINECPFIEAELGASIKRDTKIKTFNELLSLINSLQQEPRFPQCNNIVEKVFGMGNLEGWEYREAEMLVALAKEELLKSLQQEQTPTEREIAEAHRYAEMIRERDKARIQQEQPEADLEKEIGACWQNWLSPSNQKEVEGILPKTEFAMYAHHFYELGRQEQPDVFDTVVFQKGVQEGRRLEREDVKSIIQSRIDEILGDAQPNPILRMELQELIKKIEL